MLNIPRSGQRGMSLVELMVGLAVGLVLSLGLFTLIANSSQSFKVNDDFARMQDNATSALRYIGDSVRMAGFYGYSKTADVVDIHGDTVNDVAPGNDCGAVIAPNTPWSMNLSVPIIGIPDSVQPDLTPTSAATMFPCMHSANYMVGIEANSNPILITRGTGGFRIPNINNDGNLTAGLAAQPDYTTNIYLQSDPTAGLVFYGADFAALRAASSTRKLPNGNDVDIFEYRIHMYYIRPCSRPTDGVVCDATADGGNPIPTLVRQELVNGTMTEVPLVEGIERIRYQYGIDQNADGVPDFFIEKPAASDWQNVVAVKVTVLARSTTVSGSYDDSQKSYDLNGDGVVDYQCTNYAVPACKYKRKVFTQTFQIRNLAQRRGA